VTAGLTVAAPFSAVAVAPARAQTAGLETPPPTWRLQIGVGSTWFENVRFTARGQESSWSTSARASLGLNRRFRTGSFSLSGFGGRLYYPEIPEFDQWTYGGATGLSWAPSRGTQFSLSQTYARTSTRRLLDIDVEGIPLPTTGVDTATSGVSLSQRLSRRSSLQMGAAYTWRRYDSTGLVGGHQLHANVSLVRSVGKHSGVSLAYGLSNSWIDSLPSRIHTLELGARRSATRGVSVAVGGGVAYFENFDQFQFYPTGRASFSTSGRRTSFRVAYRRTFGLAFGYGRSTIADIVTAGLGWTPVERLRFSVGYTYGYRRDPSVEDFTVQSHSASAGMGWGITRGLRFSASYGWSQNQTEGFPAVSGSRVSASLSYGVDWR
jgi:hypothetical protein